MATPVEFKFYLKQDDTTWYVINNGVVSTTTTKTPLNCAPDGWMDTEIKWIRNLDYMGLFRTLTTPYNFVKDGAKILRYIYNSQGIEGICIFEIERRENINWEHEFFYKGTVDFGTYNSSETHVTVNILEGGLRDIVTAQDSTPYQIPILDSDSENITMDGIELEGTHHYVSADIDRNGIETIGGIGDFYPLTPTTVDGDYPIGNTFLIDPINKPAGVYGNFVYQALVDQDATFTLKMKGHYQIRSDMSFSDKLSVNIYIYESETSGSTLLNSSNLFLDSVLVSPGTIRFLDTDSTYAYSLAKGNIVVIGYGLAADLAGGSGQVWSISFTKDDTFDIYSRFKLEETTCHAYHYADVFRKLIATMTDHHYQSASHFLNDTSIITHLNGPWYTLLTCGDALRRLGDGGDLVKAPQIKTTLADLFKDATSRWQLGMGIDTTNAVLELEPLEYFFQKDTIIYDLGEVDALEIAPAKDWLGNQLNIGYQDQTYDGLNGRDEFNGQHTYSLPLTRVKKTLDLVSPYRADMYGIEYTRANLIGKTTTDSDSDDDIFLLSIVPDLALRRNYAYIEGLVAGNTAFNVDLSPKRSFLRNGALLHSLTYQLDSKTITFQTGTKNQSMVSYESGTGPYGDEVIEAGNIDVSDLPDPIFLPVMFKFKAYVPVNMNDLMVNISNKGCFRFTWKGKTFKGFPFDIGMKPANNDVYDFQLLSTPDNDLTQLNF